MSKFTRMFLIGPIGAGKTSVGAELAVLLGWQFFDLDQIIENKHELSINDIFTKFGEEYFRQQEATLLQKLIKTVNIVVATGGGSILNSQTRALLSQHTTVCYLQVSVSEQTRRLATVTNRPLLPNDHLERYNYLYNAMQIRVPLYTTTADFCFNTDSQTILELAFNIFTFIQEQACV